MTNPPSTKSIPVAVAIVEHDGLLLIGLREEGTDLAGYWEFPGGKVEPGETHEEAVVREVAEETGLAVVATHELRRQEFRYDHAHVVLRFISCSLRVPFQESPIGCLPSRFRWVKPTELTDYRFPPANDGILADLASHGS